MQRGQQAVGIKLVCQPSWNSIVGVSIQYLHSSLPPAPILSMAPCPQWTQVQNLSDLTFPKNKDDWLRASCFRKDLWNCFLSIPVSSSTCIPSFRHIWYLPFPSLSASVRGEKQLVAPTSTPRPLCRLVPSIT